MKIKQEPKNQNEKIVLKYLENNASDTLIEKINNGKKTLQGCWSFIVSEAKKQAINGCACISDDIVFGWAIHYFEEDSIKEGSILKQNVKTVTTQEKKPKQEEKLKVEKKVVAKEKQDKSVIKGQISIFDLGGGL